MNEQQIRDNERNKVAHYIRTVITELRKTDRQYDAKFLEEVLSYITAEKWAEDTKHLNG
jgi:hypothetical protein